MKRINLVVDNQRHTQFKTKAASEGTTMSAVLSVAIDDYLAGRFKPRKATAQRKSKAIG